MKRMLPILFAFQLVALIMSNAIPASIYSYDRTSENSRHLQLVLDSPLATESEQLSYENDEEASNAETLEQENSPIDFEEDKAGETESSPAGSTEIEEGSDGTANEVKRGNSSEPVQSPAAKRHRPTSAPTLSIVETTSPAPSMTNNIDETPNPSPAPSTTNNIDETPNPSPAPTQSALVETPYPSPAPTKRPVAETPYPSPEPTQSTVVETPAPSERPTKAPVRKTPPPVSRTERPSRDKSEPEDYDTWDNGETFSQHSTPSSSPTAPKSGSKNHALEKEAEEFVEDPYVRVATLIFGVICVTLLIIVAQQMVENPDGLCAKLCRWTVAFFRILCYPCVFCLCCGSRNKSHHTHTLVSTDGFDDYDHDLSLA